MKRTLSLLLAAALILSLSVPAFAAGESYAGKTVILYTANIHGDLDIYPQIAHIKKDYEAKGADVILVDVGNYLQGSAAANASRGEAVYALMDAVGYDAAGMGLCEFSYNDAVTGYPYHGNVTRYYTQAMLQDGCRETVYNVNQDGSKTAVLPAKAPAGFRTVCSNVEPNEAYSFQSSVDVTTQSGFTVRFYALADPAVSEQVRDGYVAVREPVFPDSSADVTVLLDETEGFESGEDMVISVFPAAPAQAGAVVIDNATGEAVREAAALRREGENVDLSRVDETVYALAETLKYKGHSFFTSQVLLNGSDKASRNGETNLGDLVTDALRWYAENFVDGVDKRFPVVAIQNGGNCDDFLYPGSVTEEDLLNALPFSPMGIGVMEVTGAQLLETLEAAAQREDCSGFAQVSGLTYTLNTAAAYDAAAAYGKFFEAGSVNRVAITSVNGAPFDPQATYNLVCDNFLMNGNDTYYTLKNAKEAGTRYLNNGPGVKVRDVVTLYVINVLGGHVTEQYAQPQGRITVQRFSDVPPDHWGFAAAAWAVEQGITQGTGEGTFSPDRACTLWEIETFLCRAMGREEVPMPAESPLCTRAMAVDLLWQAAGSPSVDRLSGFMDVDLLSSLLPFSVAWAVETGITTGTGETTFSPNKVCTRAEIAAFLFRAADAGVFDRP